MKKTFLILALLITTISFSQKEASNWFFGENAGLKFNLDTNTTTASVAGQLFTREGCASISDEFGNLLFYTEGTTVFNKNHQVMVNGFGLLGDESSTQSAIVVPMPANSNIYYVFTVGSNQTRSGLNYSVIDITLDNGLGAVIEKNTNLIPNCSEKITAVLKNCFTKDIWVVAYASENGFSDFNNTFYAFEVSAVGVNKTPVTSSFGTFAFDPRGYLKLSPDGKKVACANIEDGLYLYDFDARTGKLSNEQRLNINSTNGSIFPYGVEFSPNSQLLYVNSYNNYIDRETQNIPANHSCTLTQFNLLEVDIQNTQIRLDERELYRGGLQLGPDGKIYRALNATYQLGLPYLGVIENPNTVGLESNYRHNAINLAPFNSSQGLPPFIASFFNTKIDIIKNGGSSTSLVLCEGETYKLTSEEIPNATYIWTLNDAILPDKTPDLVVSRSGNYEVYIIPNNGECAIEGKAFIQFNPKPAAYKYTLSQCDEDGTKDGFTLFNLNEAKNGLTNSIPNLTTKFYTNLARTNEVIGNSFKNTSNPQTIYVDIISNITGCKSTSELTLEVSLTSANDVELPPLCDDDGIEDGLQIFNLNSARSLITNGLSAGLTVSFYLNYNDALLELNALTNTFKNTQPYLQTIYARTENNNSCYGISKVLLTVHKLPPTEASSTVYYCLNKFPEPVIINAGIVSDELNNYSYKWSSGEDTFEIEINNPATYTVNVINANGCSKLHTVIVEASNVATIGSIEIEDAAQNNTITAFVSGEGIYEYALFNVADNLLSSYQNTNTFENIKPGFYTVYTKDIKNNCGIVTTDVSVIGFPKVFTPNGDGFNDTWQVYGISNMFQPNTKINIYNRFGKLLKELNPLGEGWNGTSNGNELPVDDYWFTVKLQDGRLFKNHFTLKR